MMLQARKVLARLMLCRLLLGTVHSALSLSHALKPAKSKVVGCTAPCVCILSETSMKRAGGFNACKEEALEPLRLLLCLFRSQPVSRDMLY